MARLAELLGALGAGKVGVEPLKALAEEVLAEAREGGPLRFLEGDATRPAWFVVKASLHVLLQSTQRQTLPPFEGNVAATDLRTSSSRSVVRRKRLSW